MALRVQSTRSWSTADLLSDALVGGLVALVIGMAGLLNGQFRFRTKLEHFLRDREARVRLLSRIS